MYTQGVELPNTASDMAGLQASCNAAEDGGRHSSGTSAFNHECLAVEHL